MRPVRGSRGPACPDCGWHPVQLAEHRGQAKCLVERTRNEQAARDWGRCGDYSRTFRALCVPVEYLPINATIWNKTKTTNDHNVQIGPWAPGWANRAMAWAGRYVKVELPTLPEREDYRRGLQRRLLVLLRDNEEIRLAFDTCVRVGGIAPLELLRERGIL